MRLADRGGDVDIPVEQLRGAQLSQIVVIFGERRRDYVRARRGCQLHGEAPDASGRADDEDRVALGESEGVDARDGGQSRDGRGPGFREADAARLGRDEVVLRERDQLGPATGLHGRIGMEHEAEDLVADPIAADTASDLLHHAGEVATERHRELVLEHSLQRAHRNEAVDGIDRRGMHTDDDLVRIRARLRDVVP